MTAHDAGLMPSKAMTGAESADGHDTCGARTKSGTPCGRPAGWGTPVDRGRCKLHGGSTPTQLVAVRREQAREQVAKFGLPRDIDPHAALTEELQRSAGWVAWLEETVRNEGEDALAVTAFGEERAFTVRSPYYELLLVERKLLSDVAQACIRVGVEETQIRMVRESAEFAARAIRDIVQRLGLRLDDPKVRAAIEATMRQPESGAER